MNRMTTLSELYALFLQHPVVTTDSRTASDGAIFFALKGESFDGNLFADKALEAGCVCAVVDNPEVRTDDRIIVTDNALHTLQQLAALHRRTLATPMIGITGTNGKTTTKELLAAVLSEKYHVLYTQGNLNNHIGVPLTLLRLTRAHEMAVVEMGANHLGEIGELARIARPDYGLITNVGAAHLEGFGSLEGVIRAKGELYDFLRTNGGKIFIHKENARLQAIAGGLEQITYGEVADACVSGKITDCHPFLDFRWTHAGQSFDVHTQLVGGYNLSNALAAATAGCYFGVDTDKINAALTAYVPTNNRSQWRKTPFNEVIVDAYNANPDSMQAALENFAALHVHPKAVILGDMLELGVDSRRLHDDIVRRLERYGFERIILCGKRFTDAGSSRYDRFLDTAALREYLSLHPLQGYHILLKGSHGIHLENIIESL